MTGAISVSADSLRREFGRITALDDLTIDLEAPGIVGFVGPNGSGKTTFIRCLLGLLDPTSGGSAVDGTRSTDLGPDERRRVGYMPQGGALYADLTVRENVAFFARLYGVENRASAIESALDLVDLRERAGDRIATLSGGMLRRTSLAAAVVHDPDLLVLDEPTVGLDPELRATMWDRFRAWREAGSLVLVSTHYLGEASRCDRVCFLRDGAVLSIDTPEAFLTKTGGSDMEEAFLALLDDDGLVDGATPGESDDNGGGGES
ncbi:MAG: ABC transporter ATP-binding protein [Halobacteriales archaeon]